MLQIPANQTKALDVVARRQFHEAILARLGEYLLASIRDTPRQTLLARMEEWHQRALGYGITSRRALGRFLAMHLTMKPDFDQSPEARALFENLALTGDNKMNLLFARMKQQGDA